MRACECLRVLTGTHQTGLGRFGVTIQLAHVALHYTTLASVFGPSEMTMNASERTVFIISDGTGITAETFSHSVLSQFESVTFRQVRVPFLAVSPLSGRSFL
jgi:hypothetical protein